MKLLVKGARLWGREEADIMIEGGLIVKIAKGIEVQGGEKVEVLDAKGQIALPPFFNAHTHAAMAILRGYAEDMALKEWLEEKIWPLEAKMDEEDVYWGAKLACLEMIKSGTLFFNDMYWHWRGTARAVEEMGLRAAISGVIIDLFDHQRFKQQQREVEDMLRESKGFSRRITFCLGPHAIYTCSEEALRWCKDLAEEKGLMIHIHLSETESEVKGCLERHGLRPVEYLEKIGFLGPNVVLAHAIHLSEYEMDILAERGAKVVYNPISNMKLAVGGVFPYPALRRRGIEVLMGTDGCASNNSLDMLITAKVGSLLQKHHFSDPRVLPAREAFEIITLRAARAFGIKAELREGDLADLILVNPEDEHLVPGFDLYADLIYSATGYVVRTAICDGRVLMRDRKVEGEEEIREEAKRRAFSLIGK